MRREPLYIIVTPEQWKVMMEQGEWEEETETLLWRWADTKHVALSGKDKDEVGE